MKLTGRVAVFLLATLFMVPVTAPAAYAAGDLWVEPRPSEVRQPGIDITRTETGARALAAFEKRIVAITGNADPIDVAAYGVFAKLEGDPEGVWVLPVGARLPAVTVTRTGISMTTAATPTRDPATATHVATSASASSIAWQSPHCYARYTEVYGWFDHCRQFGKVAYDGDSTRDHWVLKQYGTCKSSSQWTLNRCQLKSVRQSGSPTLYWEDWAPDADTSGSCRSIDVGVNVQGISVPLTYTGCERNDITKGSSPGSFTSAWKVDYGVHQSERAVRSQIAVGVANGKVPMFVLSWDIDGARWM